MPFFGKKSEKKKSDEVSYPRQTPCNSPHPQESFFQSPQQQQAFYQNGLPSRSVVHVITRTETPSFVDRLFDGPDYHNTVRDPTIPPAPGTYIVVTPNHPAPPPQPPAPTHHYSQQGASSSSSSAGPLFPPPPSYEDVLAEEIKKKL